jgi:hypothetical protein
VDRRAALVAEGLGVQGVAARSRVAQGGAPFRFVAHRLHDPRGLAPEGARGLGIQQARQLRQAGVVGQAHRSIARAGSGVALPAASGAAASTPARQTLP